MVVFRVHLIKLPLNCPSTSCEIGRYYIRETGFLDVYFSMSGPQVMANNNTGWE